VNRVSDDMMTADCWFQLDETKRLHSMQMEELEKRTSQLQMEADGLLKAQETLYVIVT